MTHKWCLVERQAGSSCLQTQHPFQVQEIPLKRIYSWGIVLSCLIATLLFHAVTLSLPLPLLAGRAFWPQSKPVTTWDAQPSLEGQTPMLPWPVGLSLTWCRGLSPTQTQRQCPVHQPLPPSITSKKTTKARISAHTLCPWCALGTSVWGCGRCAVACRSRRLFVDAP